MDVSAIKEMIDWFLMRACLFALVVLSGFFLFAVLSRALVRLKSAAKRYGWPIVTLFIVFSSWATYTAFPTAEEKNGNVANVGMLPITNTNYQLRNWEQGRGKWEQGNGKLENGTGNIGNTGNIQQENTFTRATLTQDDFARGFVLTRIGTNEVHDFSAPEGASICGDWKAFGAAKDWVYLRGLGVSSQGLGRERLRVHSDGWVTVLSPTSSVFMAREYYPFKASLGIVPEANWGSVVRGQESGNGVNSTVHLNSSPSPNPYPLTPNSCFWHHLTTSNTLQLTWQNALYNRESDMPISVQAEFYENGDFIYRYDLSAIKSKIDSGVIPENFPSNITIGTTSSSFITYSSSLIPHLSSLFFSHLEPSDVSGSDRDGDGLIIEDELFIYHTDPYNADSDYDGLSDYDEVFVVKSNPLDAYSISNDYYDGFASALSGEDPFFYPQGSTNSVLEHVFYSGCTNGVFSLPVSTDETAVLKVCVSGSGVGRLVVGEKVVPLVAPMKQRSVAVTNMLLLAVDKGVKKSIWFTKSEGLELAIDSDDFMIGELPSLVWPHGWIAFPHTDATVPCIHDFYGKGRLVMLLHGEEFEGITASWSSGTSDVVITNVAPVSAEIYGHFKKNQTREISYRVNHPKQLNAAIAHFTQTLCFCPQFAEDEEPPEELPEEDEDEKYFDCMCGVNAPCFCVEDEWCFCYSPDCRCNENRSPTITDNEYDEVEFENILETLMPSVNALYLYRDNERIVNLEVPDGEPRHCCPCPEHWKSNYVSKVLYTSRLSVNDAAGDDFNISYEPCSVTVSGVSPSRSFRDSTVSFITNGIAYKRLDYTVLGVKISRGEWDVPFETYNRLSSQLGFPFEVCTDINNAERFYLNTDVLMTNGYVRISLEDVTGEFKIWLPGWSDAVGNWHDYEVLLDSETKRVRYMSMGRWKNILRRYWETTSLEVLVTSSAAGSCKLKLEYLASDGDSYIHDFAEQRITSLNPLLLADYNRDGKIDSVDVEYRMLGRKFRYWVNECKVKGAVWEEPSLFEAIADILVGSDNWRNQHVDGTYDLINLFPIAVDFGPFLSAWGNDLQFKITTEYGEDSFNYTFANISHSSAGSIRTSPQVNINNNSLTNAALAILERDGIIIPKSRAMSYGQNSCFMVAEARKVCDCNLKISVLVQGTEMYCCKLPVKTSSVDEMFRFVNIRGAYENEMTQFSGVAAPLNNPDYELADKDVFFVHGFNVDFDGAKNWNREMFKRFWVSGMNARYWGVTWSGDYHVISEKFNGLHYHRDVRQALLTAPTFRNLVNVHGRDAVVIGHSLGNMVVSEALLKGANARAYIMLDAAVASEAYRPQLQANSDEIVAKYRPDDWAGYDSRTWAANWYTWFTNNASDIRSELGWAGHFAPLLENPNLEVYNFYSSGDEVFAEASQVPGLATGVFHWPTFSLSWPFVGIDFTLDAFPWQKQEVFKGVNAAGSLSAGWGFHCWPTNINSETVWVKYSAADANAMVTNGSIITNAVFDRGVAAMFRSDVSDYEKADILAFHIPAVSSPAGKVAVFEETEAVDMNVSCKVNEWGREGVQVENESMSETEYHWLHSDIKNMAYYYVYPAFTNIIEKGEIK